MSAWDWKSEEARRGPDPTALPHPALVREAHGWLRAGCPLVSRDVDSRRARETLLALLDALPSHLDLYCYGTPAHREAMRTEPADG